MFSLGTPMRRPSALRPDLMAMQSSPVSNVQFSISTSRHDSGSQPSLFGPWLSTVTPRIVTFSQSTGLRIHIGELVNVTPSMSTFLQRWGWTKFGRSSWPAPKTRSAAGTLSSPICRSAFLVVRCRSPFQGHQCFGPAWPSNVPAPVMAMFSASYRVDERREVHHLVAFEAGEDGGQVVGRIRAEADGGAFFEVQIDARLEMDRARARAIRRRARRRGRRRPRGRRRSPCRTPACNRSGRRRPRRSR